MEYASPGQALLVQQYSEQKSTPEEHYKIIISIGQLTKGDASYEINKFTSIREVNSRKVYDMNKQISKDPNWFLKQAEDRSEQQGDLLYEHKIKRFNHGDMNDKAIVYLDLKEDEKFMEFVNTYPWDIETEIKEYVNKVGENSDILIDEEAKPIEVEKIETLTLTSEEVWDLFDIEGQPKDKEFIGRDSMGEIKPTNIEMRTPVLRPSKEEVVIESPEEAKSPSDDEQTTQIKGKASPTEAEKEQ